MGFGPPSSQKQPGDTQDATPERATGSTREEGATEEKVF